MPVDHGAFAWDRLREASDKIGPDATKLVAYKNTAAGYATAAVHVVSLREANVPYSVRPTVRNIRDARWFEPSTRDCRRHRTRLRH
jgi:hypothetical protein